MWRHANGPNSRSAPTMRNGKSLMQIQMTNIGSYKTGTGQSHLGIHIGPIHIYLSPMSMHQLTQLFYGSLKNPVGRRVGNHDTSQAIFKLSSLLAQVGHINISPLITSHHHDL